MKRYPARMDATLALSVGTLLLAGALELVKQYGDRPMYLATGDQAHTVYWAVLAYASTALPVTLVIGLVWVSLIGIWLGRLQPRTRRRAAGSAVGMALLAFLWASTNAVPVLLVGYQHLTSMTRDSRHYHLGVRTALDGDNFYILSVCEDANLRCESYGISPVESYGINPVENRFAGVRLEPGSSANSVLIHTGTRVLSVTLRAP